MDRKLKVHNKEDWEYFASAYLELALIGFEKAIECYKEEDSLEGFILIPSLFNFKHGIEIMLKTFSIRFLDKEYLDKSDLNHDIHEIFKHFRKNISRKEFESAASKLRIKHSDIPEEAVGYENVFNELETIVLKYINLDILKTKINSEDLSFEDLSNDALRYPSNNLSVQLNYVSIVSKIKKQEIVEIIKDCQITKSQLWKLLLIEINRESKSQ